MAAMAGLHLPHLPARQAASQAAAAGQHELVRRLVLVERARCASGGLHNELRNP
jgi:hypothetical protein